MVHGQEGRHVVQRGPRWSFSWSWGTFLSLSSPLIWVSPSSHHSLWSCPGPTGKRRWANRGGTRQPWDFLDAWLCWFIQQCTTLDQCCEEGFVKNKPKSACAYFPNKQLGIILARRLQPVLKMEALLLCCFHRYHLESTEQEEMVRKVCALQCICATRSQN